MTFAYYIHDLSLVNVIFRAPGGWFVSSVEARNGYTTRFTGSMRTSYHARRSGTLPRYPFRADCLALQSGTTSSCNACVPVDVSRSSLLLQAVAQERCVDPNFGMSCCGACLPPKFDFHREQEVCFNPCDNPDCVLVCPPVCPSECLIRRFAALRCFPR